MEKIYRVELHLLYRNPLKYVKFALPSAVLHLPRGNTLPICVPSWLFAIRNSVFQAKTPVRVGFEQ